MNEMLADIALRRHRERVREKPPPPPPQALALAVGHRPEPALQPAAPVIVVDRRKRLRALLWGGLFDAEALVACGIPADPAQRRLAEFSIAGAEWPDALLEHEATGRMLGGAFTAP